MRNAVFAALAAVSFSMGAAHAQSALDALPSTEGLPEGTVQVSPMVPGMGQHWAKPAELPLGPIYCVHEGKVICLEFMIAQEDFAAGKSWPELAGVKDLPPIDHVNIGFEANGHEGFEVPHYDIHIYFVSPDVLKEIR